MSRRSILRTSLLLLPLQLVFRAGEVVFPLLLAAWFGRNAATDVYYFSWAVFTFAGSLIFTAYHDSALVPILAGVRHRDPGALPGVTGALIGHTLLIGGGLALAIGLGALGFFAFRYHGADFTLAAAMIPAFCGYLVALSFKTFFAALLNAEHHYFAFPVASALGVATTIGLVALGRERFGVAAIPYALLAGELVAVAALFGTAVGYAGMRFLVSLSRPEPLREFARLASAQISGGAVVRINPVVDLLMAGFVGVVGGSTLLRYASDVAFVPTSLVQAALLSVLLSHLSDDFVRTGTSTIRATVVRTLFSVCGLLAAACALLYAVREPLVRLLFLRGAMDAGGVEQIVEILPHYLVGIVPFGALLVLARAHVALKNSSILLSMAVLNVSLNATLNLVLMRFYGLRGIALATSCVSLVVAVVFFVRLEARLRHLRAAESA